MTSLMLIIVLLIANGFFVAAEFALVKARPSRIASLADDGSAAARLTVRIQDNLESYLAACQLGITMASLGLGWVGEPAVAALLEPAFAKMGLPAEALHTVAFLVGFLIFSSLHIVIGEQLPKTAAIRLPEPVSLWIAYPLHYAYLAVWPLNWLLNASTASLLRLMDIEQAGHGDVFTSDELKGLVEQANVHGHIPSDQANMVGNLLDFGHRTIATIMIPRNIVICLDTAAETSINHHHITQSQHSRFPLIDSANNNAIVGIVLSKELHTAMMEGGNEPWKTLQQYSRTALVVPESQPISTLFRTLRAQREHMALVVDEYGVFSGIVTLEDLLEEIVGEIFDEKDQGDDNFINRAGLYSWEADGLLPLTDLHRETGLMPPTDTRANTLSGMLTEQLKRLPVCGDQINLPPFLVTIQTLTQRRAGKVLITQSQADDSLTDNKKAVLTTSK